MVQDDLSSASGTQTALVAIAVVFALIAHQFIRHRETYSIVVHFVLFVLPPILLSSYAAHSWSLHSTFENIRVALPTYIAAIILSTVAYRLSPVHPLASYPGPLWRRVSQLGSAFSWLPGRRHLLAQALHKKYGDVVRIGPNELSIIDSTLIVPLLGPTGYPKGPYFVGMAFGEERLALVGLMDPVLHAERRHAWNRGLGPNALKDYEGAVASRAQQLIHLLEKNVGKELEAGKYFGFFAYDFMSDMAFGGGSELLRDGDKDNVWALFEHSMLIATFLAPIPWLGIYMGRIPGALGPLHTLHTASRKLADARMKRGAKAPDLFHYLNNEDLPSKAPPSYDNLINDGILAIVAGSDTAAGALTAMLYCILTHPDVHVKLQAEIDQFYPQGNSPFDAKHHRDMSYLNAVINEALRLYPPANGGTQRKVPEGGKSVVVGPTVIAPGTTFWVPFWVLHHDSRNFSFADSFWPERWLIASGQMRFDDAPLPKGISSDAKSSLNFVHNEIAFMPFSYGPRNCPGKGLAMLEIRVVITALMQRFRFDLSPGWDKKEFDREYKDYYTATRPKLPVVMTPRF